MRAITHALLALALFASAGCTGFGGTPRPFFVWGWETLAGMALLTVALLLTLGYMAAIFLNDDKLKAWVKKEVGQLVISAVILVAAIALVGSLDSVLKGLSSSADPLSPHAQAWGTYVQKGACCSDPAIGCFGPVRNRPCHIEIATDYLQYLYESSRENSVAFLDDYWWYGFLSQTHVGVEFEIDARKPDLSLVPFAGLSMAGDYFSVLFELSGKLMMLTRAQQIFLDFNSFALFPVLLSIGLILRILYFTRKLGGLLIAISLSSYVVFPMFYVLAQAVLFSYVGGWTVWQGSTMSHTYNLDDAAGGTPLPFYSPQAPGADRKTAVGQKLNIDICKEDVGQGAAMDDLTDNFISKWDVYLHTSWYGGFGDFIGAKAFDRQGPVATLAVLMIFTMVIPFLALMTMLASLKVFSPLIGGDVEISLLSKVI